MPSDHPSPNPDRAQVRDLAALWQPSGPVGQQGAPERNTVIAPCLDADVRRLQDEVAFLTRDRDRWRERAEQAEAAARDAAEAWSWVKEERDALRARAGGAA